MKKGTEPLLILDEDTLYRSAAQAFVDTAKEAIADHGTFYVALSGGSTPRRLYTLLAERYRDVIPWNRVHFFFGDERCVPPENPQSNFRMVDDVLLSRITIPPANIHRMKGELEPREAEKDYQRELKKAFALDEGELPIFDLVLLGLGEDGHTASLFPGTDALHETSKLVTAHYVPKLKAYRLTLTPPVIQNARKVMVLVRGSDKAEALAGVLEGPYQPDKLPAQILREAKGEVTWLTDPLAAALLKQCGEFKC